MWIQFHLRSYDIHRTRSAKLILQGALSHFLNTPLVMRDIGQTSCIGQQQLPIKFWPCMSVREVQAVTPQHTPPVPPSLHWLSPSSTGVSKGPVHIINSSDFVLQPPKSGFNIVRLEQVPTAHCLKVYVHKVGTCACTWGTYVHAPDMSHITCHMSCVTSHVSHLTCQVSCVTCDKCDMWHVTSQKKMPNQG